jgi:hypothetical protein
MYEHTLGAGNPAPTIVRSVTLPANWHSKYISLLEKAEHVWGTSNYLPRKVVVSVHYATLHVVAYYETWCWLNGTRNKNTDKAIT